MAGQYHRQCCCSAKVCNGGSQVYLREDWWVHSAGQPCAMGNRIVGNVFWAGFTAHYDGTLQRLCGSGSLAFSGFSYDIDLAALGFTGQCCINETIQINVGLLWANCDFYCNCVNGPWLQAYCAGSRTTRSWGGTVTITQDALCGVVHVTCGAWTAPRPTGWSGNSWAQVYIEVVPV